MCFIKSLWKSDVWLYDDISRKRQKFAWKSIWTSKIKSTYMALLSLMENLIQALEKGEYAVGVFIDLKAFDTVDHETLLAKLEHFGIRGCALSWFKSYPSNRQQFVT